MKIEKTILSREFWKKFFSIFTDDALGDQIESKFEEMLILGQDMYAHVTSVILDPDANTLENIRDTFFLTDQRINELEQQIRRDVLVHLSVAGSQSKDVTSYLMLLNQVKDAERLGDYTKNIFEVFEYGADVLSDEYLEIFSRHRIQTNSIFSDVKTAINMFDGKLGKKACTEATAMIKECSEVINAMMADPNKVENPVAIALLFRYQKRMLSHLRKIATSQFAPFDKMGTCGKEDTNNL